MTRSHKHSAAPLYESKHARLLTRGEFAWRLARHVLFSTALIVVSLAIGTVGYQAIANLSWIDAFENAAMILTGMGPVSPMPNDAAKIFAACYALFSGTAFITGVGVIVAPLAHRLLHRFHLEDDDDS